MTRVTKIAFPTESRLQARLAAATYQDAFETELRDARLTPAQIATRSFRTTPAWVDALVRLRDGMVRPLGLKEVGVLGAVEADELRLPAVGDRLSIFGIESLDEGEIVLGIDDRHLDVRISFLKRRRDGMATYAVCSLVQTHNALGRAYMLPVGRVHPLLVRMMMRGAGI